MAKEPVPTASEEGRLREAHARVVQPTPPPPSCEAGASRSSESAGNTSGRLRRRMRRRPKPLPWRNLISATSNAGGWSLATGIRAWSPAARSRSRGCASPRRGGGCSVASDNNEVNVSIEIILLIGIFVVLIVIASRTRRQPKGLKALFGRTCPHCREFISGRATVCSHCGRDVVAESPPSIAGHERRYRGYTYIVAENGEAELK